jgi:hypothetical protein
MHRFKYLLDTVILAKRIVLFGGIFIAGILIYVFLLNFTFVEQNLTLGIVAIWLTTAYIVLPRIHRILTSIYLPDYYIGRARTGEGILGDPINIAIIGSLTELRSIMHKAGWVEAEDLNLKSTFKAIKAGVFRQSYKNAPVSSLFLFNNKQSLAFQKEVGGNTSKRHHVRFWVTPQDWMLPGGFKCDLVGAATYDKSVGFSLFTLQITHKIEADTDIERDYVVDSIINTDKDSNVEVIKNFSTGYHAKNGGGDAITTDGDLPFIKFK